MPIILDDSQAQLLRDEKSYLTELYSTLSELKSPPSDLDNLKEVLVRLDELFLIVVVGEFNAGKSALVNALLGSHILAEGVTPTTMHVTLVKYGDAVQETLGADDLAQLTFPLDFLRELNIVDTPGTNAVIRRHEELTREFIPRSDLVLFVTSADRPFTESERQFMEHIREWGKKLVIVINKRDILENQEARNQVLAFVKENARQLLGLVPEIFFVSAKRDVSDGKLTDGMAELYRYVLSWLDESARLGVKFSSPLGVADQVLRRAEESWQADEEKLAEDLTMGETVEREIQVYEREVKDELEPRLAEVDNLLLRLQARGMDFFDQNIRLIKIANLARGDRFRAMFEKEVLAGVPEEIENRTRAVVEWLVEKDMRHWQQVLSYLQRRRTGNGELVGDLTTSVDMRRQALLNSATEAAQGVISSYDAEAESRQIGASVESAVAQTALVEVGAVGLGTIITTAISVAAVDVTGVIIAGVIAIVGFFIIPYKRQQAKERFRDKIEDLRTRLMRVLRTQFGAESERALTRLKEGVAPYVRFVRGERERLEHTESQLSAARKSLESIVGRVKQEFS
ncbi:MAG: dynamin family protein [Anaerolineae bacterium]